jgi:hypothetical protein
MDVLFFFGKSRGGYFYIAFMSVHFRRAAFAQQLKSRVVPALTKAAVATIRITLNLDGTTFTSESHTHPSHSETSRFLTSSLSLRVPVPRGTQCI